jgi:hypothetical protein
MKIFKLSTVLKLWQALQKLKPKPLVLTPDKYKRIEALMSLALMLLMFIIGYVILYNINNTLCLYLLAGNLLAIANLLLFKLK